MNGRVCFLGRAGDGLNEVRLVGLRTEESWKPRPLEGEESAMRDAAEAAAWVAERTAEASIGYLCVDVDGSNCLWLTSPGADARVLAAAMSSGEGASSWGGTAPEDSSVQALAAPPVAPRARRLPGGRRAGPTDAEAGHRLAVLSVPDATAKLVIDALDDRGVEVARSGSLWHAMALAWDPASPLMGSGAAKAEVVGTEAPVTAVVLVDPTGRLVWCWSRSGELLAGGANLTQVAGEEGARVGKGDVGRLVADWLAWSVQLGVTPARAVCVTPELAGADGDFGPRELGAALGRGWSGATVDMAVVVDPIGATLGRLAGSDSPARAGLDALSARPRRVHRSMYQWASLAVGLAAVALLAVGVKAWRGAGESSEKLKAVMAETKKTVLDAAPPPGNDPVLVATAESNPKRYIDDRLATKRASSMVSTGLPQAKPILSELESLSLVLGTEGIELEEIMLSDSLIHVHVYVPESKVAEDLKEALERVANDHCDWTIQYTNTKKDKLQMVWLEGAWKGLGGGKR